MSTEVGLVKPAKEIYRLVLSRLGIGAEECVFVDDKKANVEMAAEMGMSAIIFLSYDDLVEKFKKIVVQLMNQLILLRSDFILIAVRLTFLICLMTYYYLLRPRHFRQMTPNKTLPLPAELKSLKTRQSEFGLFIICPGRLQMVKLSYRIS